MKTPFGQECPYFFGDYHRGRNVEECRLLKARGGEWTADLCKTCIVPAIARANSCESMKLSAEIHRPILAFLQRRVKISAYCEKAGREVPEPQVGCGECHSLPFDFKIKE